MKNIIISCAIHYFVEYARNEYIQSDSRSFASRYHRYFFINRGPSRVPYSTSYHIGRSPASCSIALSLKNQCRNGEASLFESHVQSGYNYF